MIKIFAAVDALTAAAINAVTAAACDLVVNSIAIAAGFVACLVSASSQAAAAANEFMIISLIFSDGLKLIAIATAAVVGNTAAFPAMCSNVALHAAISSSHANIKGLKMTCPIFWVV